MLIQASQVADPVPMWAPARLRPRLHYPGRANRVTRKCIDFAAGALPMKFTFTTDEFTRIKADVIGLLVFEDRPTDGAAWQSLDRALDGLLGRLAAEERFKAKKGQSFSLHTHARTGPARILVVLNRSGRKRRGAECGAFRRSIPRDERLIRL